MDMKRICWCFALAIQKHIEFAKGHLFLDEIFKAQEMNESDNEPMEFSYELEDEFKIDFDKIALEQ
jgi:hypothetical protein